MDDTGDQAPGWDAIDAAVAELYGDQEPAHVGTGIPWMFGGPDPLDGLSAYRAEDPPHWHIVSYGLSELYRKETDDPAFSGYGFELTFRLSRTADEAQPPTWAFSFLQNLARYVFETGNAFGHGHHMNANGPIALERRTDLTAVAFARDPDLPGKRTTPHGSLEFLQVVGVTEDEYDAMRAWRTDGVLGVMARQNSKLVTDLGRTSILRDPQSARAVAEGTAADGSYCASLFIDSLVVTGTRVRLGANNVASVAAVLPGRLGFGRELRMASRESCVHFRPAGACALTTTDDGLLIELTAEAARKLAATLRPLRGEVRIPDVPELVFEIVPSHVKDRDGNVAAVVG
ncbi:MAG TPA: suppressor of fused domain protein [Kofleriaceae bacterium]|nr:suppressor of fused domain protein [Kofleriaceae bacterium]